MKKIVLVGASGSIGQQTIDVVLQHPDLFSIVAIGVGKNIEALKTILTQVSVSLVCVEKEEDALACAKLYPEITFVHGDEGLITLAKQSNYDVFVNALVGFVGLAPTLAAIETGHEVALANKETLVVGGALIQKALEKSHTKLTPIDSEHSAIFQCLQGYKKSQVKRLLITASGGSFRSKTREELTNVTVQEALAHPNWTMGEKITIDSATMMNKGFEVMEAHWLFGMDYDAIDVVMHEESVVHSLVEFVDHSILAQCGAPDMRVPIQFALTYPDRYPLNLSKSFDFTTIGTLHFHQPDFDRFPLLKLAYEVGKKEGIYPAVLNGANEEANLAFRKGKIGFLEIEDIIFQAVEQAQPKTVTSIEDLQEADAWAREFAKQKIARS